jgi:hypothetical protein
MSRPKTQSQQPKPIYLKLAKRVAIATALVLLCVVPSAVLYAITKEAAVTWASGAFIAGVVAVLMGGVRVGILVAMVMALLAPVAIVAGAVPVTGAALMALMCVMVGGLSRVGLQRAAVLVPVFMAWMLMDPPFWGPQHVVDRTDPTYLTWMVAVFFIGSILPVIVLPFALRKVHLPIPKPHPRRESFPYTLTITLLASAATFVVLQRPNLSAGAWLVATILILVQVGDVGTVRRTIERVVGTLLGMIIVSVIVLQVHSLVVIYAIGVVFGIAALTAKFSPHYWVYMTLITPTVICFTASASSEVANLGEQRAGDTVVGAVLVLLAAALTIGYSHLEQRRGHAPTSDEPVILGRPVSVA